MVNYKKMLQSAILVLLALVTSSCSNWNISSDLTLDGGSVVEELRHLKAFDEIEINGSPTVYFVQADTFSVKVRGPQKIVENILTEKRGNTLIIRNRGKVGVFNISFDDKDLGIYVTAPDIIGVRLNGSGDFISERLIDTDNIRVVLRGSGDIDIKDMICDHCRIDLIGSGDLNVYRLEAHEVESTLIGSGDIDLNLWNVVDTRLLLKGSGDIDVNFKKGCRFVNCELHGSGDISVKGLIERFSQQKHGSGDVDSSQLRITK
ncbi:MAG: DUF2807 domain-containing protein [Prevotella sp.]|nr:DUF2807 domain-containing protein [Prevotella sp.]